MNESLPSTQLNTILKKMDTLQYEGTPITTLHKFRGVYQGQFRDENGIRYSLGQREKGTWENVAEHCLMSMYITDVLGETLGLSEKERRELNLAAWLHDSGKKTERMWQQSIEQWNKKPPTKEPIDLNAAKKQALQDQAQLEEWENCEAGFPPIVSKIAKANIPPTAEGHTDLSEKIMWLADACLSGTNIQPIKTRFDDLETDPTHSKRNTEFSNSFKDQYQGQSLYEIQRKLGDRYVAEFAEKIGIEPENFYNWLSGKVEGKIAMGQLPYV